MFDTPRCACMVCMALIAIKVLRARSQHLHAGLSAWGVLFSHTRILESCTQLQGDAIEPKAVLMHQRCELTLRHTIEQYLIKWDCESKDKYWLRMACGISYESYDTMLFNARALFHMFCTISSGKKNCSAQAKHTLVRLFGMPLL